MGYGVTYGIGSERNWATSTRKKHVKKHVEEGRKSGAFAEKATERLELETAWMNILYFSSLQLESYYQENKKGESSSSGHSALSHHPLTSPLEL